MYPVNDEDVVYEQEVLRNQYELGPWLRYIEAKDKRPLAEQVFVLERAASALGRSYKVWKKYLDLARSTVGKLDSVRYAAEYEKINALYDRALVLLHKMPRIWTDYLEWLLLQRTKDVTSVREKFDAALQALPVTQHARIWPLFLDFANKSAPRRTAQEVWNRYIVFDATAIEDCIDKMVELQFYDQAVELLVRILDDKDFESARGKSPFQLWEELAELLVSEGDSISMSGLEVERIIRAGIERYTDQKGRLYVQLATYWVNSGDMDRAVDVLEEGVTSAVTIRDFTQIFDAYVEFEETLIGKKMEQLEVDGEANGDAGPVDETELDRLMASFEQLMDRRPFLINDVLLRQDPNSVVEWEKRVGLWGDNAEEVVNTYAKAIETIQPARANGKLSKLWINYARFYETHDDLETARVIFDKATKVSFKSVSELAKVWIAWAEMELRDNDFDQAVKVMEQATRGPKRSTVDFFDETRSPQERLHKSMEVWSFYIDLVESVGELTEVRPLYDRVFELKIGTMATFVNFANLLEENGYYEDAFKVYERGVDLFSYPAAFELWNIYLRKAVDRKLGVERLRDLFEQALEDCPARLCKPLYIMYGKLEEERGLVSNALKVYDRATRAVDDANRLEMYRYYVSRVVDNFGLPASRRIFQQAIDNLNDSDANAIAQEFIRVEEKLGEIERARTLYGFASQFNNPETHADFWEKWQQFEVEFGSEETYKEMLRVKRSVRVQFENDSKAFAAEAANSPEAATGEGITNAMDQLQKEASAPVGFVLGVQQPKPSVPPPDAQPAPANPDEIDIDM